MSLNNGWPSMKNDAVAFPQGSGWRFFAESSSVLAVRISPQGIILAANRHATSLIGATLTGQPWQTMQLNSDWDLAEWLADAARPRLLNVRTASGIPQTLEVTVEPADEDFLLFGEVNATEQQRLAREVLELNHELNNLAREMVLKNDELARLNAMKSLFLGMAAHDLRKPIGLITSYSEFVIDEAGDRLSSEHQDFLRTILAAASRMSLVVDDFLDVYLIEAGRFSLNEQAADLDRLAQAAIGLVNLVAAKRGVRITTDLDATTRSLFVDGGKIEQVLANLLSNAVEHSPDGSDVTLVSRRFSDGIRVQIVDSGAGISLEQQQQLFQPILSGKAKRKMNGERSIGLGLVIVRKIVEAHGGRMFVESEPGHGSTFGFSLPASRLRENPVSAGDSPDRSEWIRTLQPHGDTHD